MKRVFYLFIRVRQVLKRVDFTIHSRLLNIKDEIFHIGDLLGGNFEKYQV
jgi:hypothetical protein